MVIIGGVVVIVVVFVVVIVVVFVVVCVCVCRGNKARLLFRGRIAVESLNIEDIEDGSCKSEVLSLPFCLL